MEGGPNILPNNGRPYYVENLSNFVTLEIIFRNKGQCDFPSHPFPLTCFISIVKHLTIKLWFSGSKFRRLTGLVQ